MHVIVEVL